MSATVTTPRAVYPTMSALAQQLECSTRALYLHIADRVRKLRAAAAQ